MAKKKDAFTKMVSFRVSDAQWLAFYGLHLAGECRKTIDFIRSKRKANEHSRKAKEEKNG